jgi:methylaspartate ammonia-lyase
MTEITRILVVPTTGAYYTVDLSVLQSNSIPIAQQYTAEAETLGFRSVREVAEAVSVGLLLSEESTAWKAERIVWGDCVGVAYAGISGRDPVLRAADALATIHRHVEPVLTGRKITTFREMAAEIDTLTERVQVPAPPAEGPDEPAESGKRGPDTTEGVSRRDLLTAPFRALRPEGAEEGPAEKEPRGPDLVTVERSLHTAVRYGVSQALLKAVADARHVTMAEVIAQEWDLPHPDRPVPIHVQSGGRTPTR